MQSNAFNKADAERDRATPAMAWRLSNVLQKDIHGMLL
jgi:hypothetical protein